MTSACETSSAPAGSEHSSIITLFEEHVWHSDRVVLTCGEARLTGRELDVLSRDIAGWLRAQGVRGGQRVAIQLHRSIELIPTLLAVWRLGASYIPIDPHLPGPRIEYMISNARAHHVVIDDEAAVVPGAAGALHLGHRTAGSGAPFTTAAGDPSAPAYTIYTSGSTGEPKGVQIPHSSLHNFAREWIGEVPYRLGSVMASITTVAFDIFVAETMLPMIYGLRVALADEQDVFSPHNIARFLHRESVDVVQTTPSRLEWLFATSGDEFNLANLRLLVVGGESLPASLLARVRQTGTAARVFNVYGPTEATIWTSAKEIGPDTQVANVGRPMGGVHYTVAPDEGELCIGGACLATGYLFDEEKTSEKFVEDGRGERLYRTGDLCRPLPGGDWAILGRLDDQVKVNGYRVELGEVESYLKQLPGVRQAAVCTLGDGSSKSLAAIVTPETVDADAVRGHLLANIPYYMAPTIIHPVADIPLNAAGKVDRHAVRGMVTDRGPAHPTPDAVLGFLVREISRLTGEDGVDVRAPVTHAKIGSLTMTRLVAELNTLFGVDVSVAEVFRARSVEQLATEVAARR